MTITNGNDYVEMSSKMRHVLFEKPAGLYNIIASMHGGPQKGISVAMLLNSALLTNEDGHFFLNPPWPKMNIIILTLPEYN